MREAISLSIACVFALVACENKSTGTLMNVTSKLKSSTCGAAVDVDDSEEFQVRLTRDDDALTWYEVDTGDTIEGSVDDDDKITLGETETYQVTEASGQEPGCAVRRHDSYSGTLDVSDDAITDFDVTVISEYTEASNYSCDALIGAEGGFSNLPCEIEYELVGEADK